MERLLDRAASAGSPLRLGDWVLDAACASTKDPDLFFLDGPAPAEALALCHACPVRLTCLAHALVAGEKYGIWGGLTPEERASLLIGDPEVRVA